MPCQRPHRTPLFLGVIVSVLFCTTAYAQTPVYRYHSIDGPVDFSITRTGENYLVEPDLSPKGTSLHNKKLKAYECVIVADIDVCVPDCPESFIEDKINTGQTLKVYRRGENGRPWIFMVGYESSFKDIKDNSPDFGFIVWQPSTGVSLFGSSNRDMTRMIQVY